MRGGRLSGHIARGRFRWRAGGAAGREKGFTLCGGFERHFRSGTEGEAAPIGGGQCFEILCRGRPMRMAEGIGIQPAGAVGEDRTDPTLECITIAYATALHRRFETVRIAERADRKAGR